MKTSVLLCATMAIISQCLACFGNRESDVLGPFAVPPPHVSGINVADQSGNLTGVLGKPDCALFAFPNPFNYTCEFSYSVRVTSIVEVEVVHASVPATT